MDNVPSLVDLCIQVAIDNVRYLGDVGETDFHLLERILPHCTLDQLMHIENNTKGRDLSPATDELWKKFYVRQFGIESANLVVERMGQKRVIFKWKQLYEAKLKDREEATQKSLDRIKKRYQEEDAKPEGFPNRFLFPRQYLCKSNTSLYSHVHRVIHDRRLQHHHKNSGRHLYVRR
ncbi:elongin-A-like isoform X2 [Primulina tabacum]|uniref:elongin-A-like isoform X2 n=1 Tax=Primulina tabacum TaxID=48773 RepID=UPI003F5A498F